MNLQSFVKGATGKINAASYIEAHRELLETEVSNITTPILSKMDKGEAYPSPTLTLLVRAVVSHLLSLKVAKEAKPITPKREKQTKPYSVTIHHCDGTEVLGAESSLQAQHFADNRLVANSDPHCYAEVYCARSNTFLMRVTRDQAFSRKDRRKPGPVCAKASNNASLSWRMKVKG